VFTVVTGRSGSGKTTLLRLLCGLDLPDRGEITLDSAPLGHDHEQLAKTRRTRVGYLAQEPAPLPFLTATENIELALAVRGCERSEAAGRAAAALADVELAERARQRVERLSAGERQRVGLARALACANGLLILDEPTSRLDQAATTAVAELLAREAAAGQTIVCASHDPVVIARADAVLEL
jgi:putative ABC transport system ATP-binding protein